MFISKKTFVAALACGVSLSALALNERKWASAVDGLFTDPTMWQGGVLPAGGVDYAKVDCFNSNSGTITFPAGGTADVSTRFQTAYPSTGPDGQPQINKLTLDFLGTFEWLDSTDGSETYDGEPFGFNCENGHFFNWEDWGGRKKYGPVFANNAKVTLWQERGENGLNEAYLRIERGEFGMREKATDGTDLNGCLVVGYGVPNQNKMSVVYDNGATGKFFNGQLRMKGADCLFAVRGGSQVRFKNDLLFPANNEGGAWTNTVEVSGAGSYLYGPNFCFMNSSATQRDVNLIAKDGGVFEVNEFRQQNPGYGKFFAENGGEIRIRTTNDQFMEMAGGTIDFDITKGGVLAFTGGGRWGRENNNEDCHVNLYTAGGTVAFTNIYGGAHNWNRSWVAEPGTKIRIEKSMELRFNDNVGHAKMLVDLSGAETTGSGEIQAGFSAPVEFIQTNGVISICGIRLGMNPNGPTDVTVGGTAQMTMTSGDGLSVGCGGETKFVLKDDAVLTCANCGYRSGRTGNAVNDVFEMQGGTYVCGGFTLADDGNFSGVSTFNLFGGVLLSNETRGWSGARWRNGKGLTVLNANGGTIKPQSDTDWIVWGVDEAYLGEKGLTIDANNRVRIHQDFRKMDGEEKGVLVLKGTGLKQISHQGRDGYNPTGTLGPTETVCCGGKTVFGNGIAWKTDLVVTDGAVASFADGAGDGQGNNPGMELSGLTLGDAETQTIGYLELDPNDQIVVDGPVAFPMAQLMFTSTPGNGTYPVIKVLNAAENFPADARYTWERMILAAGHAASGHSYTYTVTEDENDGSATLSVVIDDAVPLTDADKLVYAESGSVPLDDDVTVGAVIFDSTGTTVSGEGSLGFKDSGYAAITVKQGEHEIDVPLATPAQLPIEVADGAKLTIDAQAGLAGLHKLGLGGLALEDLDLFPGMLTLRDGVINLGTPGKDEETRLQKLTLDAPDKNSVKTPVGVRAVSPVVVEDYTVKSGLLVKGGSEPLVFEYNSNQDHTFGFEAVDEPRSAGLTLTDRTLTPQDRVTDGNPYGSITVVEGDLVYRGSIGSWENPDTLARCQGMGVMTLGTRNGLDAIATPRLVFDHVRAYSSKHSYFPGAYDKADTSWTDVEIVVTNGAYVKCDGVFFCRNINTVESDPVNRPTVKMDVSGHSTFNGYWAFELMPNYYRARLEVTAREGSYVLASYETDDSNGFTVGGDQVDMTFESGAHMGAQNSQNQWQVDVRPCKLTLYGGAFDNHFRFKSGATFHCDRLRSDNSGTGSKLNTFHFDGGLWDVGDTDYNFIFQNGNYLPVVAEGEGLVLAPTEGKTWNFYSGITGTDVVKNGKGTLVFQKNAYLTASTWGPNADLSTLTYNAATTASLGITGTLRVNEGTVKIADAAAVSGTAALVVAAGATVDLNGQSVKATKVTGAGTVKNGTLEVSALELGETLPTFDGVTFTGTTTVDFAGQAVELKKPYVIGHYTGTAPTGLKVKAVNTGIDSVAVDVACADGDITVTLSKVGFTILVY